MKAKEHTGERQIPSWTLIVILFVTFLMLARTGYAKHDLLNIPAKINVKASSSLLLDIVNTGQRLVCVGELGHILYSDDNGSHWKQAEVPTSVTLTAVYFPTPQKGWAVGHDGIVLHTTDSGKTWKKQMDGLSGHKLNLSHSEELLATKERESASSEVKDKDSIAIEIEELEYRIDEIKRIIENDKWGDPLMDVWFKDELEGFVLGSYGLIYRTNDGGTTWTPWWDKIENPEGLHYYRITEAKGTLLIAGEYGTLYKSIDGGWNWRKLSSPYNGTYFGAVSSQSQGFFFAFGLGGNIVGSLDLGETWELIQTEAAGTLSCATIKDDNTIIIVSYTGEIIMLSPDSLICRSYKVGAAWSGVTTTADGDIVLVGLRGVRLVRLNEMQ